MLLFPTSALSVQVQRVCSQPVFHPAIAGKGTPIGIIAAKVSNFRNTLFESCPKTQNSSFMI
jgi:hypothetical protein